MFTIDHPIILLLTPFVILFWLLLPERATPDRLYFELTHLKPASRQFLTVQEMKMKFRLTEKSIRACLEILKSQNKIAVYERLNGELEFKAL